MYRDTPVRIPEKELRVSAERHFARAGGHGLTGKGREVFLSGGRRYRDARIQKIDIRAVVSFCDTKQESPNSVLLKHAHAAKSSEFPEYVRLTAPVLEQYAKTSVTGAYVWFLSVSGLESTGAGADGEKAVDMDAGGTGADMDDEGIVDSKVDGSTGIGREEKKFCAGSIESFYETLWEESYLAAAVSRLKKDLAGGIPSGYCLSPQMGPGYYGMSMEEIFACGKLADPGAAGVEISEAGSMRPAASSAGIYFVLPTGAPVPDQACRSCVGDPRGCGFCLLRNKD
ncbi:hypothetical protein [Hornefia butyriciproducens]|uniref:hypothetical protein n=1 Tax=Hornefia butyriciproducens TaxID=2652293 RepID=UPI0029FDD1DB|nr:hypothetical protein [Hornefia butyriciproducens]MDD7019997.1 hypothetical protein [Hornefia butyriciproducens]MDY5463910.1 hypothetical protein [Hornefia butyriciproducens]